MSKRTKQSGVTVAVTSPVLRAVQTAAQQIEAAGDTRSDRMKALAVANAAINLKQAADALAAGQGMVKGADGELVPGNAADKAGGIGISVSLGSSRSQSSDSARGSSVTAGGDVNISARGAGADSDIAIQGSTVKADGTTRLSAEDEVRLLAARNTQTEANSQSSKSGSVGLTFATTGISATATATASRGQGQGAGDGTTFTNTQVSGQSVQITSGGDTTLQGAVVQGEQVAVNVGGKLTIDSQQDSSRYNETSKSAGFSVSVPITGANASVSVNAGKTNINSNYQSVQDGKNTFSTAGQTAAEAINSGALTLTDLNNRASFEASGVNIGVGVSRGEAKDSAGQPLNNPDGSAQTKTTPNNSAGFGCSDGAASSTTVAAISGLAGNTAARTGDAAKAHALRTEARRYDEGGVYRIAAHTALGALTGGADGALGAAASQTVIDEIGQLLKESSLSVEVNQVLVLAASTAIGAASSGPGGGVTAFNATANNYLSAADLRSREQRLAAARKSGDVQLELSILREYDLKNSKNTANIEYKSVLTEGALKLEREQLQDLLEDPTMSGNAKTLARQGIRELDVAINVIQKAPALQAAAELGLIVSDIVLIGGMTSAGKLTADFIRNLISVRSGQVISRETAEDVVKLYRGVHAQHPAIDAARRGSAVPRNPQGIVSPEAHNLGGVAESSPFTSWSRQRSIAIDHANKTGPGGVVLEAPVGAPPPDASRSWVFSPDVYGEAEVLLKGIRSNLKVTKP